MELNRRCVKTCDAAITSDVTCLKAYLIKGKALEAMGKVNSLTTKASQWRHGGRAMAVALAAPAHASVAISTRHPPT